MREKQVKIFKAVSAVVMVIVVIAMAIFVSMTDWFRDFSSFDSPDVVLEVPPMEDGGMVIPDEVIGNGIALTSRKVDDSWWTKLWNDGEAVTEYTTRYDGIEAIHAVTKDDFKSNETATCEALFIDRNDYAEFKEFYDRSVLLDETVVLVRYDVGNYIAAEASEGLPKNSGLVTGFDEGDTNARVFSMSVYLGLDVIHLEFDNGEEEFFLPCVSSPIDAGSDGTEAAGTHSDAWRWVFALLALLLLILILVPILPPLIQAVLWLVTAPFKLIASGVKSLKSDTNERKKE